MPTNWAELSAAGLEWFLLVCLGRAICTSIGWRWFVALPCPCLVSSSTAYSASCPRWPISPFPIYYVKFCKHVSINKAVLPVSALCIFRSSCKFQIASWALAHCRAQALCRASGCCKTPARCKAPALFNATTHCNIQTCWNTLNGVKHFVWAAWTLEPHS